MAYLSLKIIGKQGNMLLTACDDNCVSAVYCAAYQPGDMITLEIGEPNQFCIVQFEDTMPPTIVYVCQQRIVFPVPILESPIPSPYNPKSFSGNIHVIRARFASPEEIASRRNLALNPYDNTFYGREPFGNGKDTGFFPHATSNIQPTNPGFAPRNAIDGVFENVAHLVWPYQAWSNNQKEDGELTIDFGRLVCVDEIRITLRADFPHDSWWTSGDIRFSDKSTEHLTFEKTSKTQVFPIQVHMVTNLTLCNLKKHEDSSLYTALTQIEVWGTEATPKSTLY